MSFWNDVTPQAVSNAPDGFKEFQVGDNEAWIQMVNETTSQSGNRMLVITFRKMDGAEIKHYIVDDEYKMQKLKQLYLCFGIPMGNMEIDTVWKGKTGVVVCKKGEPYDGKCYNKVSYLRPLTDGDKPANRSNGSMKPGYMSSGVGNSQGQPYGDSFSDDIPF